LGEGGFLQQAGALEYAGTLKQSARHTGTFHGKLRQT